MGNISHLLSTLILPIIHIHGPVSLLFDCDVKLCIVHILITRWHIKFICGGEVPLYHGAVIGLTFGSTLLLPVHMIYADSACAPAYLHRIVLCSNKYFAFDFQNCLLITCMCFMHWIIHMLLLYNASYKVWKDFDRPRRRSLSMTSCYALILAECVQVVIYGQWHIMCYHMTYFHL